MADSQICRRRGVWRDDEARGKLELSGVGFWNLTCNSRNFSSLIGSLACVVVATGGILEQICCFRASLCRSRSRLLSFLVCGVPVHTMEGPSLEFAGCRRPVVAQVFGGGRNLFWFSEEASPWGDGAYEARGEHTQGPMERLSWD
ncbi:hypothetical protein F2Q68_00003441 [Brassica cretica]|uniref:Uncharacterized protein n=1 Tax=Brassica cretica TaxID=69181 RepID=A0A8S9JLB3_BRACR|nr:hypothetical protein F2Q68_00003441 [Brassica cretica]